MAVHLESKTSSRLVTPSISTSKSASETKLPSSITTPLSLVSRFSRMSDDCMIEILSYLDYETYQSFGHHNHYMRRLFASNRRYCRSFHFTVVQSGLQNVLPCTLLSLLGPQDIKDISKEGLDQPKSSKVMNNNNKLSDRQGRQLGRLDINNFNGLAIMLFMMIVTIPH
jgi:tetrahydromethanopterin S-methyltransferase subunit G